MCNRQLQIDLASQELSCLESGEMVASYPVSTGLNGPGESQESGCTPRGKHRVRIKIGADCPLDTVFVGRRPSGERYSEMLAEQQPERDWVLTRIIWLSGLESGFNRGGRVDTLRRYIYIHGTPDSEPMGVPRSHGCIRMRNRDLIELFDWVEPGMLVEIRD
ncbi:MAG: L,D-transpeptidase [Candidatus Thiodiazotropha sp. (ex Ctena orbiculata)]|nr:L,D-transpeptidase [Candidatus Thiodiazotropha taylori]